VADVDGRRILEERAQSVQPWWGTNPDGSLALAIRMGKLVEFSKAKQPLPCRTWRSFLRSIDTLIAL
jgi:hypothetical protein